jgi:hypothetical protein
MGTWVSTTGKTGSKQLLKQICLGTLRSIKERVETPTESGKATTEGTLTKSIGIKARLL